MSPDLTHHETASERPLASQRLPATIDALPRDAERPAQTQFTRELQATFLRRLADCGEVRVAARTLSVSHQTVYRMRRACRVFARGWDAALIVARERAEDMLASRAMHGVEEEVYYHGEVVAKRRRYDARLLLAHLARLDRKAENPDMAALAEDFDAVVDALEGTHRTEGHGPETHRAETYTPETHRPESQGAETHGPETHGPETYRPENWHDEQVSAQAGTSGDGGATSDAPAFAGAHQGIAGAREEPLEETLDCTPVTLPQAHREISSGLCNMWSMSPRPGGAAARDAADAAGEGNADERDADGLESDSIPALEKRLCAMEAARPPHALTPAELAEEAACSLDWLGQGAQDAAPDDRDRLLRAGPPTIGEIEAAQLDAFEAGEAEWWRVIGPDALGVDRSVNLEALETGG